MRQEFPEPSQRRAVCETQWREHQREAAMAEQLHYPHVIRFVTESAWAILPSTLAVIVDLLAFRATGGSLTAADIQERIGAVRARPTEPRLQRGVVAVLPLFGVISHRASLMTQTSGGTSIEAFRAGFRQAMADPMVGAIVLDVDSPGGAVPGVDEMAAEIFAARKRKKIYAVANDLAASAAYWLASAASELSVIPSGEVGSIGVLAVHEDLSRQLEMRGIRPTVISAGRFKGETTPFAPLSDEAYQAIQGRVDDHYAAFTRSVARHRAIGVDAVRSGFGEGRVVGAAAALREGMVDRIETLDQVIERAVRDLRAARVGSATVTSPTGSLAWVTMPPEEEIMVAEPHAVSPESELGGMALSVVDVDPPQPAPRGDVDRRRRRLRLAGH